MPFTITVEVPGLPYVCVTYEEEQAAWRAWHYYSNLRWKSGGQLTIESR